MEKYIELKIQVTEDDADTVAHCVLDLRGDHFEATGKARRNPTDPARPEIGEELAIARALGTLQTDVLEAAQEKIHRFLA